MKEYPVISRKPIYDHVYMFDKLDGSNIRAEWSRKRGFYKFGSRHQMIDERTEILGEAVILIKSTFEDDLNKIFLKNRFDNTVCFFEFYGENSFAGTHTKEDHTVSLIDVSPKGGFINPDTFVDYFGDLDIAKLLYTGKFNKEIELAIRKNEFDGITFEGVVCKLKRKKQMLPPEMFKVKTQNWLDKLKTFCNGNEIMFEKLM